MKAIAILLILASTFALAVGQQCATALSPHASEFNDSIQIVVGTDSTPACMRSAAQVCLTGAVLSAAVVVETNSTKDALVIGHTGVMGVVWATSDCDSIILVECLPPGDTVHIGVDYPDTCILYVYGGGSSYYVDFTIPPGGPQQPPQYEPCSSTHAQDAVRAPPTYQSLNLQTGQRGPPQPTPPPGLSISSLGTKHLRQGLPDSLAIALFALTMLSISFPFLKMIWNRRNYP